MTNCKPTRNLVFLDPIKEEREGSIFLPLNNQPIKKAVAVAVGPKAVDVKVGDIVYMTNSMRTFVEYEGKQLFVMREEDIDMIEDSENSDGDK